VLSPEEYVRELDWLYIAKTKVDGRSAIPRKRKQARCGNRGKHGIGSGIHGER